MNRETFLRFIFRSVRFTPFIVLVVFYLVSITLLIISPYTFLIWMGILTLYQVYIVSNIGWFSHVGYNRMLEEEKVDWKALYESGKSPSTLKWDDVVIYCIIPNYKEDESVLRDTLNSLMKSKLSKTHLVPVLAMEAREDGHEIKAKELIREFKKNFKDVIFTAHPPNIKGERAGKSSNENYAVRQLEAHITKKGYKEDHVLISIADADSLLHSNYFEAVVQKFCCSTKRYRTTWQAPMINYLNIDRIPVFSRLLSFAVTAEFMAGLASPHEEKIPFSTYTLAYRTAKEVDFWDPEVCAEDWHMYLKSFFLLGEEYTCEPIFLPVHCYSVGESSSYYQGCKDRYDQAYRHFIAISEIIYFLKQTIIAVFNFRLGIDESEEEGEASESSDGGRGDGGKKKVQFSLKKWLKVFHRIVYPMVYAAIGMCINTGNAIFFAFYHIMYYTQPENQIARYMLSNKWCYFIQVLNTVAICFLAAMLYFSVRVLTREDAKVMSTTHLYYKRATMLGKMMLEYFICSPITITFYAFYPAAVNMYNIMKSDDFEYVVATKTAKEEKHL